MGLEFIIQGDRMCCVEGCNNESKVKGMCSAHYQRWNRYGSIELRGRGARPKHGMRGSPTYKSWQHMKDRCLNPKCKKYKDYGGRGIKVCDDWMSFESFFRDMGLRPDGTTIDRIDTNGDYGPGNCRWATQKTQNNNRRRHTIIKYSGVQMNISQWADGLGIPRTTLINRIHRLGWDHGRALGNPSAKACRAIVAAKFGGTVEVPEELL